METKLYEKRKMEFNIYFSFLQLVQVGLVGLLLLLNQLGPKKRKEAYYTEKNEEALLHNIFNRKDFKNLRGNDLIH